MPEPGIRRVYSGAAPGVSLWLADLDNQPQQRPDDLSSAERERAARFVFERDRQRYTAAHVLLRGVLAEVVGGLGESPARLRIGEDCHGKPVLLDHPRTHFNLSHSAQWALIGVTGSEIGVDIEVLHEVRDLDDLARHHFTPAECAQLAAVPAAERHALFLTCWTRKEACLKAIGLGLSVAPHTFEAGALAVPQQVHIAGTAMQAHELLLLPLALPVPAVASLALVSQRRAGAVQGRSA